MENINLELYKIFCCVAQNKNITKASNKLFISQPAVTQSIKKLENQIGYKLFYRTKQGVELTDEGLVLYDYIRIPIECLNNSVQKIIEYKDSSKRIVRIGSGTTLIKSTLMDTLKVFKDFHKEVKVEIKHSANKELFDMLSNDLLDIVIMNLPCESNDNIIVEPIEEVEDIFVAKRDVYKEFKNITYDLKDLNKLPLVLQLDTSTARKFLNNICRKEHVELKPIYELASYGLILDFVNNGLGVGYVNKKHVQKELETEKLFQIKTSFIIPKRQIGVAINKKSIHNTTVNQFIEILKNKNQ